MGLNLRIGSLFSGVGGLELGLEWAGVGHTAWQVERDEYARRVLAKHWPNVRRYEDVCEVGAHNLEPVDVICGGFPCQDISFAGAGAGLDGARSGLWFEFARIVRELRPLYVVVENVAALRVRGLDVVLGTLAAIGYHAVWDCIPAASVGAHHRRDRLFIVARRYTDRDSETDVPVDAEVAELPGDVADAERLRRDGVQGCTSRDNADRETAGRPEGTDRIADGRADLGDSAGASEDAHAKSGTPRRTISEPGRWLPEPDVGRVADGVPSRVDRLKCIGNAVVPQVAEVIGRAIVAAEMELRS